MSVNKHQPHLVVIPEDDANRQLINGFSRHFAVALRRLSVERPAQRWREVLGRFELEYIPYLRSYGHAHNLLALDFDQQVAARKAECDQKVPDDLKPRAYLLGARTNPETLRNVSRLSFEQVGITLAGECDKSPRSLWQHEQLAQNLDELNRLMNNVRPFLFQDR